MSSFISFEILKSSQNSPTPDTQASSLGELMRLHLHLQLILVFIWGHKLHFFFSCDLCWGGDKSIFHASNSVWMRNLLGKNPEIKLSPRQCLVIVCAGLAPWIVFRVYFFKNCFFITSIYFNEKPCLLGGLNTTPHQIRIQGSPELYSGSLFKNQHGSHQPFSEEELVYCWPVK